MQAETELQLQWERAEKELGLAGPAAPRKPSSVRWNTSVKAKGKARAVPIVAPAAGQSASIIDLDGEKTPTATRPGSAAAPEPQAQEPRYEECFIWDKDASDWTPIPLQLLHDDKSVCPLSKKRSFIEILDTDSEVELLGTVTKRQHQSSPTPCPAVQTTDIQRPCQPRWSEPDFQRAVNYSPHHPVGPEYESDAYFDWEEEQLVAKHNARVRMWLQGLPSQSELAGYIRDETAADLLLRAIQGDEVAEHLGDKRDEAFEESQWEIYDQFAANPWN